MFKEMIDLFMQLAKTPIGVLEIISIFIIGICALALFTSILINFVEARTRPRARYEKKSIVETGTMFVFFIIFYILIRFRIGVIDYTNLYVRVPLIILGLVVIVIGTYVNIKGRLVLGKNWANQIKIYTDQTFVTKGVYRIVRHPLYASLIWIFYAVSIIYLNYAAFLANTFVFIPFMYYRAKQEEKLLIKQFKNYKKYQLSIGMFFPKIKNGL